MKIFLTSTVFVFAFGVAQALACICGEVEAPIGVKVKGEIETSSAVFSGTVVGSEFRRGAVAELSPVSPKDPDKEVKVVRFKVDRWWKMSLPAEALLIVDEWRVLAKEGDLLPQIVVSTCQMPFAQGESYLIYARGPADKLQYRTCSRTAKISEATDDLKILGKGRRPPKIARSQGGLSNRRAANAPIFLPVLAKTL